MGKTFKGYNGFPDLSTYNFSNTGLNLTEIWGSQAGEFLRTNLFRVVGGGTFLDFRDIVENGPLRTELMNADPNVPSTWYKMYEGIQLMELSGSGTSWTFRLMFAERDLIEWSVDTSVDPPVPNEYEKGPQEVVVTVDTSDSNIFPEVFRPRMAILYFDEIICPYDNYYLKHVSNDVYKIVLGNGNKASTGSVYWDDAITPAPKRRVVELDENNNPQIVDRYDWLIGGELFSGDEPNNWWSLCSYNNRVNMTFVKSWGGIPMTPDNDTSGTGGNPNVPYDDRSDPVPYDGVPSIGATSSGFVKLYHVNSADLLALKNYLYSSSFLDNVSKLINNPMDYIIALMCFPLSPTDSTSEYIGVGGLSSSVSAPKALQYKEIDCGSINVAEKFNSFMDYDNLTQVSLYLPFCGMMKLDTNVVMHSSVKLYYNVDFLTGDCVARVIIKNNHGTNAETYIKEGNCACQIPMSGANYMSFYAGAFKTAMGIGASLTSGNMVGAAESAINGIASMKVERERIGNVSGNHGLMSNYNPYIMIERPVQNYPENYNAVIGRPSNIGGTLGSFSGYTVVNDIKLDSMIATDAELAEIRQLLAGGVYV